MTTYYARMIEGQSHNARIYTLEASRLDDARREARRDYLGGCLIGEGRVEIYDVDPRTDVSDPVEVLEA